jgi:hypothetical protein
MLSMTAVSAVAEETEGAEADQVQSAEPAKSTETAKNKDKDSYDPDELRCKRITKTGSRIKTRVCATNREWEESEKRAQESTEKMQKRPQQGRDSG